MSHQPATRIVLSYPEDLSDWGRRQLDTDRYRAYLRRVLDEVAVGDEFEEFADVGCCGDTLDITFRVEAIDGAGSRVGEETTIEYDTRRAPHEGGWLVQSNAGAGEEKSSTE